MSKVPRQDVAEIVAKLSEKSSARKLSRDVAAYLLETGRTSELESLLRDIIIYRAEHGVVEVVAASAHPLSAAVQTDIKREVKKRYPDAKHIIIDEQLDPDAVGGVRLELPSEQLDLTVRGKLNQFKQLAGAGV